MSDNTIASMKALLASQKQQTKTQLITQEKILAVEATQLRIEAALARIEETLEEFLAEIRAEMLAARARGDESTFADLVRAGEEEVEFLGDYITAYNEGDRAETLHESLGLTAEELVALLERPEDVNEILGIATPATE